MVLQIDRDLVHFSQLRCHLAQLVFCFNESERGVVQGFVCSWLRWHFERRYVVLIVCFDLCVELFDLSLVRIWKFFILELFLMVTKSDQASELFGFLRFKLLH